MKVTLMAGRERLERLEARVAAGVRMQLQIGYLKRLLACRGRFSAQGRLAGMTCRLMVKPF
jgi:hypothetical protein